MRKVKIKFEIDNEIGNRIHFASYIIIVVYWHFQHFVGEFDLDPWSFIKPPN